MPPRRIDVPPREEREAEDHTRLKALRRALEAGEARGVAKGNVLGEVRERLLRRAKELYALKRRSH